MMGSLGGIGSRATTLLATEGGPGFMKLAQTGMKAFSTVKTGVHPFDASFPTPGFKNVLTGSGAMSPGTMMHMATKYSRMVPEAMEHMTGTGMTGALGKLGYSQKEIDAMVAQSRRHAETAVDGPERDPGQVLNATITGLLKQLPTDQKEQAFVDVLDGMRTTVLSGRDWQRAEAKEGDVFVGFRDKDSPFSMYYFNGDQARDMVEKATVGDALDPDRIKDLAALPGGADPSRIFVAEATEDFTYLTSAINPLTANATGGGQQVRPGGGEQSQVRPSLLSPRQEVDLAALKARLGV